MKKLFTSALLIVLISASVFCQPPQAFTYQAVVRNNAGEIISNQAVGIQINIRNGLPLGTIVYQESHTSTTNDFGLVNIEIGEGTPSVLYGNFEAINWGMNPKYMEVLVDASGGTNYVSIGTSELSSVPYALYTARSADAYWGLNNSNIFYNSGNVGIGTSSPDNPLVIKTSAAGDAFKILSNTDNYLVRLRHTANNSGALYLYDGSNNNSIFLYGEGSSFINSGNLGIGTTTPNAPLHVNDRIRVGEDPTYGTVYGELYHEGGGTGFKINAHAGGGSWADMYFQTNGNTRMFIESAGNVGIGTTSPASRLDVQGNVTIRDISTGDIAIQLGKGLDYAEGFDVSDDHKIEPGTILCIDTNNPGQLKVSENPYDKTVAGIVAGANGLGSGVRLGSQEFDCDVALAGRVYCNTIAISDDIKPGDLLTTSSIPGFAMKVNNFEKAQGAIIGKAMENLKKGEKGQILVLVTLQ